MTRYQMIGALIVLIIVASGSFYVGTAYGKGQAPARGAGQFAAGAGGFAGRGTRGAGGGFTGGQIVSSSNGSISILQQNGSSTEIVLISPTTQILKSVSGSATDLSVGANVTVTGSTNSDGSLTANSIQIRPAGAGLPRAPGQ